MPVEVIASPMRDDEWRKLANLGGDRVHGFDRALLTKWLTTTSVATLALLFIAASWPWVIRQGLGDPGWAAGWLAYAILACPLLGGAYGGYRVLADRREVRANRARVFGGYWADADAGVIQEEHYRFLDGRSVHEPEGRGQIYLLRCDDARCLVIFDLHSFDLADAGRDPLGSAMQPAHRAVLRRAPASGLLMGIEFSGAAFDKTPSHALGYQVPQWSDHGKIWSVSWERIVCGLDGSQDASADD